MIFKQYNSFLGSAVTLINSDTINQFKSLFTNKTKLKTAYEIQLHPDFPDTVVNIYSPPQRNRAYILGADPSTRFRSEIIKL